MSQRSHALPRILGASAVTLVGGTVMTAGQPAQALSYEVTNTNASGDGSLYAALLDAKNNPGPDTITFSSAFSSSVTSTITLTRAYVNFSRPYLPVINYDLTIIGPGSGKLTIDANNFICDVFSTYRYKDEAYLNYDATVTISGLTITNADCDAIDINEENSGGSSLTLNDVVITYSDDNAVEADLSGSVSITNSTFKYNGEDGIELYGVQSVTIDNVTSSNNGENGIGLYGVQSVTIDNVTSSNNGEDGFEFDSDDDWSDTVSITNSTFNGNRISGVIGWDVEILTLTNVTANDNGSYGVYVEGIDSVTVTDSTFTGNDNDGLRLSLVYVSVEVTDVTASANHDGVNLNQLFGQSVAVTRLTANDNEGHGLEVDDSDASVEITDVTASGNDQAGVKIEDIESGTVTVTRLTADDNLYGVYIERTDPEAETMIVDSSFDGNDEGVRVRLASADLERITISNSYADGIIGLGASITVTNSTVTSSGRDGIWLEGDARYIGREPSPPYAAIYESVASDVTVSHSTITGNTGSGVAASDTFRQYVYFYNGPGDWVVNTYDIDSAQDITVDNTIVSGNGDVDVYNASENNAGDDQGTTTVTWSLVDEGSAHTGTGNVEADDPKLGALADNGGETLTMLPADDSPAISAGNPSTTGAPATDQRGVNRIVNRLEIGAVEVDADQGTITVLPPSGAGESTGITVPVTRSGVAEGPSSITLRSCDGVVRTLSWADGETGTKTATFPLTDNATDDPDRICTIEIVSRTGADPGIVASWPVTVTDLEDSPAELPATGSSGTLAWMAAAVLGIGTAMSRTGRRRTN